MSSILRDARHDDRVEARRRRHRGEGLARAPDQLGGGVLNDHRGEDPFTEVGATAPPLRHADRRDDERDVIELRLAEEHQRPLPSALEGEELSEQLRKDYPRSEELIRQADLATAELKAPVHLAFSYDEEVGCLGAPDMIKVIANELPKPALVVVGEPTNMEAVRGHKGISTFRVVVTGRTTKPSRFYHPTM